MDAKRTQRTAETSKREPKQTTGEKMRDLEPDQRKVADVRGGFNPQPDPPGRR